MFNNILTCQILDEVDECGSGGGGNGGRVIEIGGAFYVHMDLYMCIYTFLFFVFGGSIYCERQKDGREMDNI